MTFDFIHLWSYPACVFFWYILANHLEGEYLKIYWLKTGLKRTQSWPFQCFSLDLTALESLRRGRQFPAGVFVSCLQLNITHALLSQASCFSEKLWNWSCRRKLRNKPQRYFKKKKGYITPQVQGCWYSHHFLSPRLEHCTHSNVCEGMI